MRFRLAIVFVLLAAVCYGLLRGRAPIVDPALRFELYDYASYLGQNDRLTPRSRDPNRYAKSLIQYRNLPDAESIFAAGYGDGFDKHPEEPMALDEAEYDRSYRQGCRDRCNKFENKQTTKAYVDGYSGHHHAFGRPY
jgi:hypothetical protein